MKKLFKFMPSFGAAMLTCWGLMFLFISYVPKGLWSRGKAQMLYKFGSSPSEEAKLLLDSGIYGYLSRFILIQKKLKDFSQAPDFSRTPEKSEEFLSKWLSDADRNFLAREIHTHSFYRDLMILMMTDLGINGDSYGLSKDWLRLYARGMGFGDLIDEYKRKSETLGVKSISSEEELQRLIDRA